MLVASTSAIEFISSRDTKNHHKYSLSGRKKTPPSGAVPSVILGIQAQWTLIKRLEELQSISLSPTIQSGFVCDHDSVISPLEHRARTVQNFLWILDLGCSKHTKGNRALLTNFVEKILGTVRFGNC
ncbi:hypothetical protein Tco_0905915 [Tanacetum coccineum]